MADSEKKASFAAPRPVPRAPLAPVSSVAPVDPLELPTMLMPRVQRPLPVSEPMTIVESSTPPEERLGVATGASDGALPSAPDREPRDTVDTDVLVGAKETRQLDLTGAVLAAGDRIGTYVVERVIGSGGMGVVVAARHEGLNELVAIKVLRPKAANDEVHAERFAREARAIVKIKSEHVVRVLDAAAPDGGAPFIVMEYLVGRDLARILREEGPMPLARAAVLMLQICEAVASAHAVGVIHRDLKPSNFFVTTRADGGPLVKVLDFGISKAIGQDGIADPNLTETQAVFGSPTYMSPEQIRSAKHVDQRSDIWSLGVGFYEILTGKLPFAADNVAGLLASIVADPPFFPRAFVPELPADLETLLLQCLAKDARERVQSVAELAFRLVPFAPNTGVTHDLVARIDRLAAASAGHTPTGPHLPAPLPGPALPRAISHPDLAAPMPLAPVSARGSGTTLGHASFGSTGPDLSAEAAGIPRRGGIVGAAAVGIVVALLVLVGVVGAYELGSRRPVAASPVASPSESGPSAPPSVATASVPAVAAADSVLVAPSATPSAGPRTAPRASHARPHPAPRPGPTTKPVDPTNDRY